MNINQKMKKLEERQDSIISSFTPEQQDLILEAIDIEYKLTMAQEGHFNELNFIYEKE